MNNLAIAIIFNSLTILVSGVFGAIFFVKITDKLREHDMRFVKIIEQNSRMRQIITGEDRKYMVSHCTCCQLFVETKGNWECEQ